MGALASWLSGTRRRGPAGRGFPGGLAALENCAILGMASLAPDGRFLSANAAFQKMVGYSEERLRRMSFGDITHPEDSEACERLFEKVQRGELDHFEMEKRYVRADGELIWAHVVVAAVRGGRGELRSTIGVAVDITDRKRADRDLRENERRCTLLYEGTPAMLQSIDAEGRLLSVSDRWLSALGYDRAEVLGRPFTDFLTPESRKLAEEVVLPAFLKSGFTQDVPYQYVRKDGSILDALLSSTCERDSRGNFVRSLAVITDVTKRRRAEDHVWRLTLDLEERVWRRTAELEYKNALLEAELSTSPDGIAVVGEDRRLTSYNRRFQELWRIPDAILEEGALEAIYRHIEPMLVEPARFRRRAEQLWADRAERALDVMALKDGRSIERYSSPIFGATGRYFGRVYYFRDISALARSNAELEMFAAAASHDLNAPLGKIVAWGDLLARRTQDKLDATEREMLDRLRASAAKLARLVSDALTLARTGRDVIAPEDVDLSEVLEDVRADLETVAAESGAIIEAGPLPIVRAHRTLMHRLLQNLLSNALKFRRPGTSPHVRVRSRREDAGVVVEVADDGIGLQPGDAERLFRPFQRLVPASEYQGSGIGLAVCHRIVSRYGGRISARGNPDMGTVISAWLPERVLVRFRDA